MKLGIIISSDDAESVFHAFRFGAFARKKNDQVKVFLMGKAVGVDAKAEGEFKVIEQIRAFLDAGGKLYACGSCLKQHNLEPAETRPASKMDDYYDIVAESDRILCV